MWWFGASGRVRALEERFDGLERRFKAMELEWVDTYDKLRKALGRVVKSRAIMEQHERDEEAAAPTPMLVSSDTGRGLLTERQKQIQQQILRRRAGGGQ
jgi:hypothetical protein